METYTIGQSYFSLGIQWTKPLATTYFRRSIYLQLLQFLGVSSGVVLLKAAASLGGNFYQTGYQIEAGYSAKDGSNMDNNHNLSAIYANILAVPLFYRRRQLVEFTQNAANCCFSLKTGNNFWGPLTLPNASPFSSLGMQSVVANGTIYLWAYGGDVYAYKITDWISTGNTTHRPVATSLLTVSEPLGPSRLEQ